MAASVLKRILVVEDDPMIGEATGLALEESGDFTVKVCACAADTVEAAKDFRPDLLLLDANLPDGDGPEILSELRQEPSLATLPVIFVTGQARTADTEKYRALGAIGVIAKPFDPFQLVGRIRGIWEGTHG